MLKVKTYRVRWVGTAAMLLGLVLLLVWPVWGTSSAVQFLPTATTVTGAAWVSQGVSGVWRPLRVGDALPEGSVIRTEARARVQVGLGPHGSLVIGPGSTLSLPAKPRAGEPERIRLALGRVWVSIVKRFDPDARFEVVTPSAVVSVRGTLFAVSTSEDGESRVSVQSGLVTVTAKDDVVSVEPGMQTRVRPGQTPEKPAKMDKIEHDSWSDVSAWAKVRLDSDKKAGKDEVPPGQTKPKPDGQTGQSPEDGPGKSDDSGKGGNPGNNGKGQPH